MGANQTKIGVTNSNSSYQEDETGKKKREQVLEEIVKTEQSYVNYLCVIDDVYLEPMRSRSITSGQNIQSLFGTIEPIIAFHRDFFTELAITYNTFAWTSTPVAPPAKVTTVTTSNSTLVTTTTTTTINTSNKQKLPTTFDAIASIIQVFNKHSSNFKIYSSYIVGYDNAIITLNRLKKKSSFNSFIEKCRSDQRSNGQDLNSLLIMPVQRLPRYVLLLNELLKSVPDTHPTFKLLQNCIDSVKGVTQFINDAKRDDDNMARMRELQDTLIDKVTIMEPGRKLVCEGIFNVHSILPLKDKDELLKRIRKSRKQKKMDAALEASVFPEEYRQNAQLNYCIFNDSLTFLFKPPKSSISNILNSSKVWSISDCSLLEQVKAVDVLDIFSFKNGIILFSEKSCYFITMSNAESKQKILQTIVMSKVEYRKSMAPGSFNPSESLSSSVNNGPSLLTLRPASTSPQSGSVNHKSSLSVSSSSSSNNKNVKSISSPAPPPTSKSFLTLGKSSKKEAEKPPAPRKSSFFFSQEK